jgi:hypothetical protein
MGLMIVSTLTGLTTEAIKNILTEHNRTYHANTLAAIVSVVLSVIASVCYILVKGLTFTGPVVVCIVALTFMSWLCAMVGYDKVVGQFKNIKEDNTNA